MKTAYCIAVLYIDYIAVSAIPTYYGQRDDFTGTELGKRQAWPCKDMRSEGWSKMALTKPNAEAVINSMFKAVKPPCNHHIAVKDVNHHIAVKDVKVPDITQEPDEEAGQMTPNYKTSMKNFPRANVTLMRQPEPKKSGIMAAAAHNKPTKLGNLIREEAQKIGAFTNIINSKIVTPKLAHILPLWIPQRKYFNVRHDENLILRNQRSNSLHKDRQLNSNVQFTILHGPKDFFYGENFNIDKLTMPGHWNKLPFKSNVDRMKQNDKTKRHAKGVDKEVKKNVMMSRKELLGSGKFYRVSDTSDSKGDDLLKYLNDPSTVIYGPVVPVLRGD